MAIDSFTTKTLSFKYEGSQPSRKSVAISNTAKSLAIIGSQDITPNPLKTALVSIPNLASNIDTIGDFCFYQCSNLSAVAMSANLKHIGAHAFDGCSSITNLKVLDSSTPLPVLTLGPYAFSNMSGITSIILNLIGSDISADSLAYNIDQEASKVYGPLNSPGTFANCPNLKYIHFSAATPITKKMFSNCYNLTDIEFYHNYCSKVGQSAFENCIALKTISFGSEWSCLPHLFFDNCSNLTSVSCGSANNSKLVSIGNNVFKNCLSLSSLTIYSDISLDLIDENALAGSSIQKIYIPAKHTNSFLVEVNNYSNFNKSPTLKNAESTGPYTAGTLYKYSDNLATYAYSKNIPLIVFNLSEGSAETAIFDKNVFNTTDFRVWCSTKNILFARLDNSEMLDTDTKSDNFSGCDHASQFLGCYDPDNNIQTLGMWAEVPTSNLTKEFIKENSSNIKTEGDISKIYNIPEFKSTGHSLARRYPIIHMFWAKTKFASSIVAARNDLDISKTGLSQIKQLCSKYFTELDELKAITPPIIEKRVFTCYGVDHDVEFIIDNATKVIKWDSKTKKIIT